MKVLYKYTNGNYDVVLFDNGTKVRVLREGDDFDPSLPENIDMKLSNRCPIGCTYCHERSTPDGDVPNLNEWIDTPFFNSLRPGSELALGGGALSSLPMNSFQDFLDYLSRIEIVTNITVNQREIDNPDFRDFVKDNLNKKSIFGVGISYYGKSEGLEEMIRLHRNNVVVHVINGLLTKDDVDYLSKLNCKILILGYKNFGRGADCSDNFLKIIENNKKYLESEILRLKHLFKSISFDCLAVEQLNLSKKVNSDEWDKLYMGDDGKFTMYVDIVSRKYGVNSITPESKRHSFTPNDKVSTLFKNVRKDSESYHV